MRNKSQSGVEVFFTCAFVLVFLAGLYYVLACFLAFVWDNVIIPNFWQSGPIFNQWQVLVLYLFLSIIAGLFRTTVNNGGKK